MSEVWLRHRARIHDIQRFEARFSQEISRQPLQGRPATPQENQGKPPLALFPTEKGINKQIKVFADRTHI